MPPAVRIESKAWDDPRFTVMGKALGLDRDLVLIKFARVWAYQTEESASQVPLELFDAITGIDGSGEAAVAAGLADRLPDGMIRPRGTEGRIEWLDQRREEHAAGRAAGGRARAATARRGERGRFERSDQQETSITPANTSNDQHRDQLYQLHQLSPAPAPAPAQEIQNSETAFPRSPAAPEVIPLKPGHRKGPSSEERVIALRVLAKLNERTGRSFGSESHVMRIVRLLRAGHTERDLRMVVWERCNRWLRDERMAEYCRPSTLFGPQKFDEYLAEARAAFAEEQGGGGGSNGSDPRPPPAPILRDLWGPR